MKTIDRFLNSITMYKLVLWGLSLLAAIALVLSFFGLVAFAPLSLLESLAILLAVAYVSNWLLAKLFRAATNVESSLITALILFFVMSPPMFASDYWWLAAVALIAMASKYILAIKRKHLFNPVAISAVIIGLLGSGLAIWWVATPALALPVAILGFFIVRKIRRAKLFWAFALTSIVIIVATTASSAGIWGAFEQAILSWPLLFFGTIMLTEPTTTPPTAKLQMAYGFLVALIFSTQFHFGPFYSVPELALVIGNLFSYIVSPKQKLRLEFVSRIQLTPFIYDYAFSTKEKIRFAPGQYLEWTLPHRGPDSRGNRRYFTIASSPTESEIHLGVRIDPNDSSSFKKKLFSMQEGDMLVASQLAGDFTLHDDPKQKLAFVAGGIGITPFRSMLRYISDREEKRDVVLFYACATESDFAYKSEFDAMSAKIGLKIVYVDSSKMGRITPDLIAKEVPDYKERSYYLSGPNAMVTSYKKLLLDLGIHRQMISTDYFPGF